MFACSRSIGKAHIYQEYIRVMCTACTHWHWQLVASRLYSVY